MPALLPFPVTFPFQLSSTIPDGDVESARKLSDRLIYVNYYISLLLGVPMDADITGPTELNASLLGTRNLDVRVTDGSHATFDADYVLTGALNNHLLLHTDPALKTLDIGLAGPISNGRDQAAAFPGSSFIHTYWISNGTNLRVLASLSPPLPAPGPTLPSGYNLGAYAGALRLDAGGALVASTIRGRWTWYTAARQVVILGTAATDTVISCSGSVPPNATKMTFLVTLGSVGGSNVDHRATIKHGLLGFVGSIAKHDISTYSSLNEGVMEAPNYGQNLFYALNTATGLPNVTVAIIGFENASAG